MQQARIEEIIIGIARILNSHKDELTALDQAIGDGDHGVNITRGFAALVEKKSEISQLEFPGACQQAGLVLVMSVGGASGPLFGSCIMKFGTVLDRFPASRSDLVLMLDAGIDAIKHRGKSDVGAKTLLDVLAPLCAALAKRELSFSGALAVVTDAVENTRDMIATKGRAAFLGERSIGHIDPGARSVALIVEAICKIYQRDE